MKLDRVNVYNEIGFEILFTNFYSLELEIMSNKPKLPLLHTTVMNVKSLPPVPHVIPITHPNTPTMLEHQTLVGLTSTSNGKKSENDRPYHCPACQKKFRQMGHLQQHIRIHTNDRPYQCAHCDKRFKQRSQVSSNNILMDRQHNF